MKMIDLGLIVGTAITLLIIVGYSGPLVISPLDDLNTTDTEVLFHFDKADKIILDDNL